MNTPLQPDSTLADLAVAFPAASRVFRRHGLDYCCHGRRPVAEACAERGWEHHVQKTTIGEVIDDLLDPAETPCPLCARLRRGVLYRLAGELGATKIALGHHADDLIETLLMAAFFTAELKSMPPLLKAEDGRNVVIRPLCYCFEDEVAAFAAAEGFPVVSCGCPIAGCLQTQRHRIKALLRGLEAEHPGLKANLLSSLGRVRLGTLMLRPAAGAPPAPERPDRPA